MVSSQDPTSPGSFHCVVHATGSFGGSFPTPVCVTWVFGGDMAEFGEVRSRA